MANLALLYILLKISQEFLIRIPTPYPQKVLVARLVHGMLHREFHFLQLQCENLQSAVQITRT